MPNACAFREHLQMTAAKYLDFFTPYPSIPVLGHNRQVEKSVSVIPFFKIGEVVFGTGM